MQDAYRAQEQAQANAGMQIDATVGPQCVHDILPSIRVSWDSWVWNSLWQVEFDPSWAHVRVIDSDWVNVFAWMWWMLWSIRPRVLRHLWMDKTSPLAADKLPEWGGISEAVNGQKWLRATKAWPSFEATQEWVSQLRCWLKGSFRWFVYRSGCVFLFGALRLGDLQGRECGAKEERSYCYSVSLPLRYCLVLEHWTLKWPWFYWMLWIIQRKSRDPNPPDTRQTCKQKSGKIWPTMLWTKWRSTLFGHIFVNRFALPCMWGLGFPNKSPIIFHNRIFSEGGPHETFSGHELWKVVLFSADTQVMQPTEGYKARLPTPWESILQSLSVGNMDGWEPQLLAFQYIPQIFKCFQCYVWEEWRVVVGVGIWRFLERKRSWHMPYAMLTLHKGTMKKPTSVKIWLALTELAVSLTSMCQKKSWKARTVSSTGIQKNRSWWQCHSSVVPRLGFSVI